jgi:hypothetical protein
MHPPLPLCGTRPFAAGLGLALAALLVACPSESMKTHDPPTTCARSGDSCTVSPGKLGLCTESSVGAAALVCQSLH